MRIIALEYHDVVADRGWDTSGFPGDAAATYKLSVERFGEHLAALSRASRRVTTDPTDAAAATMPPVVLTFDDGGSGYIAFAADLLERHGWHGCVFMTTGQIGKPGFLSASDLRALHARGHLIGTHSRSHPVRMSALSPADLLDEWRSSKADLEDALGAAVDTGSVPGGYHSHIVAQTAAAAGLATLYTSEPESTPRLIDGCTVIGRYTLRQNDSAQYAARLVTDSTARMVQWCRWNAKKVVKALGGTAYLRVRERMLKR